jgi:hypothetical protein
MVGEKVTGLAHMLRAVGWYGTEICVTIWSGTNLPLQDIYDTIEITSVSGISSGANAILTRSRDRGRVPAW